MSDTLKVVGYLQRLRKWLLDNEHNIQFSMRCNFGLLCGRMHKRGIDAEFLFRSRWFFLYFFFGCRRYTAYGDSQQRCIRAIDAARRSRRDGCARGVDSQIAGF